MRLNKRWATMLAATVAVVLAAGHCSPASALQWHPYNKGMDAGRTAGKKVFLYFYADWCTYCKKMEDKTFADTAVRQYMDTNFVAIRVNADNEKALARQYGASGMPVSYFLTPKGHRISKLPGYFPPDRFLKLLKYVSTDSYRKMPLSAFKE